MIRKPTVKFRESEKCRKLSDFDNQEVEEDGETKEQ